MTKAYRLKNGIVLDTEPELKAYIRGLEMARKTSEICTEGRTEFLAKISTELEEAHAAKSAGATEEVVAEGNEDSVSTQETSVDAEKSVEDSTDET